MMIPQVAGFDSIKAKQYLYGRLSDLHNTDLGTTNVVVAQPIIDNSLGVISLQDHPYSWADLEHLMPARPKRAASIDLESFFIAELVDSPFEELESIRADDTAFINGLSGLQNNNKIEYKAELINDLKSLLAFYQEDYEGKSLSAQSLQGLVSFLEVAQISKAPGITATANGDLYTQWKYERYTLSIHFIGTFNAKYALVKPNHSHPEKWAYNSGATTVDILWNEISALNLHESLLK